MFRIQIGALLAVLCFGPQATATETRLDTLRDDQGLRDVVNVYDYPAIVNEYSLALIELGTRGFSGVYGGAVKDLGKSSAGVIVSRDAALLSSTRSSTLSLVDEWLEKTASNTAGNAGQAILPVPERPIEILFGGRTGGGGWGLRLVTASYLAKTKNTEGAAATTTSKASQIDLHFGYSLFGANRLDLGLGLGFTGSLKQDATAGATTTKNEFERGTALTLTARKFVTMNDDHAYFGGRFMMRSPKVEASTGAVSEEGKFDEKEFQINGGYVLKPTKDVFVAVGARGGIFQSKGPTINAGTGIGSGGGKATPSILTSDSTVKRTSNYMLSTIGVEAPVYNAFGILGGLEYLLFGSIKEEDKITAGKPTTETSLTETADSILWSLGLFYDDGPLRVDASYSKTFLHNGPNFVSGETTSPLLVQISAAYKI